MAKTILVLLLAAPFLLIIVGLSKLLMPESKKRKVGIIMVIIGVAILVTYFIVFSTITSGWGC
jgi:uncharacterized RDD family membrane protein YckC